MLNRQTTDLVAGQVKSEQSGAVAKLGRDGLEAAGVEVERGQAAEEAHVGRERRQVVGGEIQRLQACGLDWVQGWRRV